MPDSIDLFRAEVRTPAESKEVRMADSHRALPARPDLEQKATARERFRRAVRDRDVAELRRLHGLRAELRDAVNEPAFAFDSPALVAIAGDGDVDLIDALLALGADPNRRSDWWAGGFHALYAARGQVAERLLAAGAVPDACAAAQLDRDDLLERMLSEDPSRVHERGGDGQTPLHFARSRLVVDLLLDHGADIDALDVDHRSTPAQWMLGDADRPEQSRAPLARYLVDRGAAVDIFLAAALGLTSRVLELIEADRSRLALRTSQGDYGEKPPSSYHIYQWTIGPNLTPLQTAARFGHRETVDAMRRLAPPAQLLLLACHEGDRPAAREIVRAHPGILESLADVDRQALAHEAWAANAPAVELMMELGFDPAITSSVGSTGSTPLHCAAWEGSVRCVTAILGHPSRATLVTRRDGSYNATPLGWCCEGSLRCRRSGGDYAEVARLLIAAGARPDSNQHASAEVEEVIAKERHR
jgi:ankyrin repeat protein